MYFNNIHILVYLLFAILGLGAGIISNWCNYRMPENKKIFSKDFFHKDVNYKSNILLYLTTILIYIALLYFYGIGKTFLSNIKLIKYIVLTPMLLSAFIIDYKYQIIPNRLNLTIFEFGIIMMFAGGIYNVNIAIDSILGMIAGGGVFLLITLVGGLIAGKEAMGFGDVKFMCGLGILFGLVSTGLIAVMSFLIGAIISIVIIIIKKKKNEYIPFGPFIVAGSFIIMFVPLKIVLSILLLILSLGTIRI